MDASDSEKVQSLKALLQRHADDERTRRCLAALSDAAAFFHPMSAPVPSDDIYRIYEARAEAKLPTIEGYATLLPALKEKAQKGGGVCVHSVTTETEWFLVFTDEEVAVLYGMLSEKSDRIYRYYVERG
jgi:hypothetical protein